jgi:hypothetical protein
MTKYFIINEPYKYRRVLYRSGDEFFNSFKNNVILNYEYFYKRFPGYLDYKLCTNLFKNKEIEKELIEYIWHPKRIIKWLDSGKEIDEYEYLFAKN